MDPSQIQNIFGLLAFLGVCLVGIVQIRQQRKNGPTTTANGNGGNGGNGSNQGNGNPKYATTEYVDLRIDARLGQHEIHCGNVCH